MPTIKSILVAAKFRQRPNTNWGMGSVAHAVILGEHTANINRVYGSYIPTANTSAFEHKGPTSSRMMTQVAGNVLAPTPGVTSTQRGRLKCRPLRGLFHFTNHSKGQRYQDHSRQSLQHPASRAWPLSLWQWPRSAHPHG